MQQILDTVRGFDGILELAPTEGSEFPEIAWGDHFFYYSPNGQVPQRTQPYATIVTKNYPDEAGANLSAPGRWRLNIHVGSAMFTELTGEDPKHAATPTNSSAADVLLPHPVYAAQGWVAIVNPAERTTSTAIALLRDAHESARRRATRRGGA